MSLELARAWLETARNTDGSWGYLPSQPGRAEPSLLATAAGFSPPIVLLSQELGWEQLLLPAVLSPQSTSGADPAAVALRDKALAQILARKGEPVEDPESLLGFDPALSAWPWVVGTAPWVEPTAYALISLSRCGLSDNPRVAQGRAMLLDRQCADGGWNYGNPEVLGSQLESDPPPTAWACMALPPSAAVDRALAWLDEVLLRPSSSSLSLLLLARLAHGLEPGPAQAALLQRQAPDGSFGGRVDWTALALCALAACEGAPHPFAWSAP